MPNHIHLIIEINNNDEKRAIRESPLRKKLNEINRSAFLNYIPHMDWIFSLNFYGTLCHRVKMSLFPCRIQALPRLRVQWE